MAWLLGPDGPPGQSLLTSEVHRVVVQGGLNLTAYFVDG